MDDRQWLAPEALAVLDGGPVPRRDAEGNYTDWLGWRAAARPLLSPRARTIKEAVERMRFDTCVGFHDSENYLPKPLCQEHGPCKVKEICRAYIGTGDAKGE